MLSKLLLPGAFASLAVATCTSSAYSRVEGKVFDRFISIWLENTDYAGAAADPNMQWLASKGQLLTNYFASTHPSEPNYVSAVGGDYFGMQNDALNFIPANVSTVVDLLEDKHISWSEYEEGLPYTGFTGFQYLNQVTGANNYVRKHNPLVVYNSISDVPSRLECIKNFTLFYEDLAADILPQWIFITPNMTDDGHDTSVTFAANWARNFLTPLLENPHFLEKTLILLTFDENEDYPTQNRVFTILLGDALPKELVGTQDDSYYDHYSGLSTVQANWGLHSLGRYDVGANVFKFVGEKTDQEIRKLDISTVYNNESYPGTFNSNPNSYAPQPVPDIHAHFGGRTVLPAIKEYWEGKECQSVYKGHPLKIPTGLDPPVYPKCS